MHRCGLGRVHEHYGDVMRARSLAKHISHIASTASPNRAAPTTSATAPANSPNKTGVAPVLLIASVAAERSSLDFEGRLLL